MKSPNIDHLINRLKGLSVQQLEEVEAFIERLESTERSRRALRPNKSWPHAPVHQLHDSGTFIVTAGTLHKEHIFRTPELLEMVEAELLSKAADYGWQLEAWAVFSNHYHFVGHSPEDPNTLKTFLSHLHGDTAREVNRIQDCPGRQVWFNFWESKLTFEKSYLARLNYVHANAVHHGLVDKANEYRWCSAAWFERSATLSQVKTIYSFKTDKVNVVDEFDGCVIEAS